MGRSTGSETLYILTSPSPSASSCSRRSFISRTCRTSRWRTITISMTTRPATSTPSGPSALHPRRRRSVFLCGAQAGIFSFFINYMFPSRPHPRLMASQPGQLGESVGFLRGWLQAGLKPARKACCACPTRARPTSSPRPRLLPRRRFSGAYILKKFSATRSSGSTA